MQDEKALRRKLRACNVVNEYSGLDEFREFAKTNPARALDTAWDKITKWRDLDEGMTIWLVLEILSDVCNDALRSRLFEEWGRIDDEHRQAIVYCARSREVLRLDDWLRLFNHEQSTVHDRHLLVAALASGSYTYDFAPHAATYVENIGRYDEEWHNEILLALIDRLRVVYRIS